MKRLIVVFVVCLVFAACSEEIQPLKSLQKGTPNTITLSTGDVVYDLNGEWDFLAKVVGFGTFSVRKRAARQGRNPQTGETIKIKASRSVAFKPSKTFKDMV